jgi:hypothetical protein
MVDDLSPLGEAVTDRTLVLNVIRGLNKRFSHVGTLLRRARPFPTFLEARDDLILEELSLQNKKEAPATALLSVASSTSTPPSSSGPGSTSKNSNSRRSKRGGGGKGGSNSNTTSGGQHLATGGQQQQLANSQQAARSWPSYYNPWMGSIHMWPGAHPPMAPISVPPHPQVQQQARQQAQQQAQQQALLAQQQQHFVQPPVAPPDAAGQ